MEITKEYIDGCVGLLAGLIIISSIILLFVNLIGSQNHKYEIQSEIRNHKYEIQSEIRKNKYEIDDSIEKAFRRYRK